jgi:hypothetical protein
MSSNNKPPCDNFSWDPMSAIKKLIPNASLSVPVGPTPVRIHVPATPPFDPTKDAYRNCGNCGNHYNYHK